MTTWKRWQDYATVVFGVLLFISPFVFGATSHRVSSISAYVLGVLLVASGIVAAATREARRSLIVNAPGVAAVITLGPPCAFTNSGRGQNWIACPVRKG